MVECKDIACSLCNARYFVKLLALCNRAPAFSFSDLTKRFNVTGIPTLIVVTKGGQFKTFSQGTAELQWFMGRESNPSMSSEPYLLNNVCLRQMGSLGLSWLLQPTIFAEKSVH